MVKLVWFGNWNFRLLGQGRSTSKNQPTKQALQIIQNFNLIFNSHWMKTWK